MKFLMKNTVFLLIFSLICLFKNYFFYAISHVLIYFFLLLVIIIFKNNFKPRKKAVF